MTSCSKCLFGIYDSKAKMFSLDRFLIFALYNIYEFIGGSAFYAKKYKWGNP